MPNASFRGVYAVLPTPFHDDGSLDEESLGRCVEFCIAAAAHGIVTPVVASETSALFDEERLRIAELVLARVNGRIPVVIGVTGVTEAASLRYSQHAVSFGADAVIAMPPGDGRADERAILGFYTKVARAVERLPVWIQHYPGLGGTVMSAELLARLLREILGVEYLKEETALAPQTMTRVRELAGDSLKGMMGGMGGRYLIDEVGRGASGTMPACEVVDVHVMIWNSIERRDDEEARRLHTRLLPLLNYEAMYGFPVWKHILVRRGVIDSARTRVSGAAAFDAQNHLELDRLLADLDDLLILGRGSSGTGGSRGRFRS
jgi:dihydrodipicolinate synthase/N-acetylneuraminate lyase